jgi:hypothetical protein
MVTKSTLVFADRIPQIFNEAQKSKIGHRKLFNGLRKLHLKSVDSNTEIEFNRSFVLCLNHILASKQRAPSIDRSLDFIQGYISFSREKGTDLVYVFFSDSSVRVMHFKQTLCAEYSTLDLEAASKSKSNDPNSMEGDEDEDNFISTQFSGWLINYLLNGIGSKEKNVRYRCARLIYNISTHLASMEYVWSYLNFIRNQQSYVKVNPTCMLENFTVIPCLIQ